MLYDLFHLITLYAVVHIRWILSIFVTCIQLYTPFSTLSSDTTLLHISGNSTSSHAGLLALLSNAQKMNSAYSVNIRLHGTKTSGDVVLVIIHFWGCVSWATLLVELPKALVAYLGEKEVKEWELQ